MTNLLAAAILTLYTVSSGGIVLVEYSCHETGTSGVAVPAPQPCYAPACGDEAPSDPDACCDHACCEIEVRSGQTDDQIAGGHTGQDDPATTESDAGVMPSAGEWTAAPVAPLHSPAPPSPGFNRPIRI
jgi:hypothetical protein